MVKRWHEPISPPKRHCRSRSATETILRAHFALSLEIHLLFSTSLHRSFPLQRTEGAEQFNPSLPRLGNRAAQTPPEWLHDSFAEAGH